MKTVLIIGMGKTGRHLARRMHEMGNEVHVIDQNADRIDRLSSPFADVKICDCTNRRVVESLNVESYDHCFVMIGSDFQSSLVVTSLLKSCGARHVVAKARDNIQHELLLKIGADEVVKPEEEIADRLAVCYNSTKIFDYIPIGEGYAFYETAIPKFWIGKGLRQLDIRRKYKTNVVAILREKEFFPTPPPDFTFAEGDRIIVLCAKSDISALIGKK